METTLIPPTKPINARKKLPKPILTCTKISSAKNLLFFLASVGIHALGPNVLASAMLRKRKVKELLTDRQNKRQHEFVKLQNKFIALHTTANKPEHMLSVTMEICRYHKEQDKP
jgi:hypothetical protein